jgi:hypothetical protein
MKVYKELCKDCGEILYDYGLLNEEENKGYIYDLGAYDTCKQTLSLFKDIDSFMFEIDELQKEALYNRALNDYLSAKFQFDWNLKNIISKHNAPDDAYIIVGINDLELTVVSHMKNE